MQQNQSRWLSPSVSRVIRPATLAAFDEPGGLEPWIADQRWEAVPGGWRVREWFQDWHFRVEPVAGGVSLVRSLP